MLGCFNMGICVNEKVACKQAPFEGYWDIGFTYISLRLMVRARLQYPALPLIT